MTRRSSQGPRGRAGGFRPDKAIAAIPGYGEIDLASQIGSSFEGDPVAAVAKTRDHIVAFLEVRDPIALLAKSGEQLLREMIGGPSLGPGASGLDQVHVELLQAFVLRAGHGKPVPTSPKSIVRLRKLLRENLMAYLASSNLNPNSTHDDELARRVRLHTIFYRNLFNSDDAMEIVPALLKHMDVASRARLGFTLSDFARALYSMFLDVGDRFAERIAREQVLREGRDVEGAVGDLIDSSEIARRMWCLTGARSETQEARGMAGFQLAEMLCTPLFTLTRTELVERFGTLITAALFSCSLKAGSLTAGDSDRLYLENPIWRQPFIALDADTLFLPLPVLLVSFPFAIMERVIGHDERLLKAYADARSRYLEDEAERIIGESLPSARVHRGVSWIDPDTGKAFENDVVAVVGMHVLVVEAKSGRLKPASRRGGVASLRTNFRELYVEPGEQAARLEAVLARGPGAVTLVDRDGVEVRIESSGPCVVYKFGLCVEQFASVTSSGRLFRELGLLGADQDWAPILTLGELRMLSAFLDTEVAFLHYLTRRSTIDDVLDFVADEQDLLSMYLSNGFAIDAHALAGRQVLFLYADAAVRGRKEPRSDRTAFATPGVQLPRIWRRIAEEIHATLDRHRFDKLFTILNQQPSALSEVERRVRRWRSGGGRGKGNTLSCRAAVGDRVFVVAVHFARNRPEDAQTWTLNARCMASDLAKTLGATDCLLLLMTRRSSDLTFDAISFFRFPPLPTV
ncbi:MAG: hypothetical protein PGN25_20775 [Methylorubrum populi]